MASTLAEQKKWNNLPCFDSLPEFSSQKGCAWEVWGKGDELGTVNLLTDTNTAQAAKEEINTGTSISLNWPVQFPAQPAFGRKSPEVTLKAINGYEDFPVSDEELHINTQSGSQWDGLRHFGVIAANCFYGGVPQKDIKLGTHAMEDPMHIDPDLNKLGVHNWAQHGIVGRGVFLDMVRFYLNRDGKLPYDPLTTHGVPLTDLIACAKDQGVTFRQADILILRVGFTQAYYEASKEQKVKIADHNHPEFAGVENTEEMRRWLWDNHFSAVASDQPTFESWPPKQGENYLHETLLGLWGCPIGEFFDLEALSKHCAKESRWTFFFSSWPLNILGGAASPPNAAAYF